EHPGPFDYRNGTYYPDPSQALTDEYFSVHGIGAVVVTDRGNDQGMPQRVAQSSELLDQQDSIGAWDVFAVRALNPLVTDGDDAPASVELANGRIAASFDDGDGTVVIRENWFPRWRARADGEPVPVIHRDDGFMELHVPSGAVDIELVYTVTALDWIGRIAAVNGGDRKSTRVNSSHVS